MWIRKKIEWKTEDEGRGSDTQTQARNKKTTDEEEDGRIDGQKRKSLSFDPKGKQRHLQQQMERRNHCHHCPATSQYQSKSPAA